MSDDFYRFHWDAWLEIIPSGEFIVKVPPVAGPIPELTRYSTGYGEIYNPMSHPSRIVEFSERVLPARSLSDGPNCVSESELSDYAAKLVEIARAVKRQQAPDCILAPLRGALKPAQLLKVIARLDQISYIPFKDRSSEERRRVMRRALIEILTDRAPERGAYRVVVLDTAISGHGAEDLSQMIVEAHQEAELPPMEVTFHLLHDSRGSRGNAVERISRISGEKCAGVRFEVHRHPVLSLIVEDWDAALGVTVELVGTKFLIEPLRQSGALYVSGEGVVRELESDDLSNLLLQKMGEYISDTIRTDPTLRQVDEVWKKHL